MIDCGGREFKTRNIGISNILIDSYSRLNFLLGNQRSNDLKVNLQKHLKHS